MANSTVLPVSSLSSDMPRVVIVGAGIGGLVAALLLASRGIGVTVVERAGQPGGKLRPVLVGGQPFDCGPTVLTMRSVFADIFAEAGTNLSAHLDLVPQAILARHAWRAGEHLDLHADIDTSADAIGRFAGAAEARGYRAFCAHARDVYRLLEDPFIHADRPSMPRLLRSLRSGAQAWRIAPFATLWRALGGYFRDPRLRQLFGRYATYCGSSPFACPATLMLVAHVEQSGVWRVEGGMSRIALALATLARARGAVFRYDTAVEAIVVERGRAAGADLATGERLAADAVICNADVAALPAGLLGGDVRGAVPARRPSARSLSAMTFALKGRSGGFPLLHHNVFFPEGYKAEFDDIFGQGRLPETPTVYVCAEDRDGGGAHHGPGTERLFCIVNAPPTGDSHRFDQAEITQCETRMLRTLERCGLRVERDPQAFRATTPTDFARLFPGTGGALYGTASHGWTASFRRPGVRSRVPGLYLCGGSVHPGPGLPMAAISGRMAAWSLTEDWGSRRRSPRTATRGGMSTP